MQEHQDLAIKKELLHTEAILNITHEKIQKNDPIEIEIVTLRFGNSGLRLVCSNRHLHSLDQDNMHHPWAMHFTPEHSSKSKAENRFQYSRMFAAGFVSMVNTLVSEKTAVHPELSKVITQHPLTKVDFYTNDTMWNFVCKLVGEKYFIKIPQNFSNIPPAMNEPIRRLLDEKGWPGNFLLGNFLIDYSTDPTILNRCIQLASDKKIDNLTVKNSALNA